MLLELPLHSQEILVGHTLVGRIPRRRSLSRRAIGFQIIPEIIALHLQRAGGPGVVRIGGPEPSDHIDVVRVEVFYLRISSRSVRLISRIHLVLDRFTLVSADLSAIHRGSRILRGAFLETLDGARSPRLGARAFGGALLEVARSSDLRS